MAHANGARTVEPAAMAGLDSVEHGAYLDTDALRAMRENRRVQVPTLSTIGNLAGSRTLWTKPLWRRFWKAPWKIVAAFAAMGGLIAPEPTPGRGQFPHGSLSNALLEQVLGENAENILRAAAEIQRKF